MKFKLFSVLFLALITSACSHTSTSTLSDEKRAGYYIEAANGLIQAGDSISALQLLDQAENYDSKLPELHLSRAVALFHRKNLQKAILSARRALELDPASSSAKNTLGRLLIEENKMSSLNEAEIHLVSASNDYMFRDAHLSSTNLGILYLRKNKVQLAESAFSKAIAQQPTLACVAYFQRGTLRMKAQQTETAIRDLEKSVQKWCTNFGDAHLALGIAYQQNKNYDQARKKYLEIQKRYPDTSWADRALANLKVIPDKK